MKTIQLLTKLVNQLKKKRELIGDPETLEKIQEMININHDIHAVERVIELLTYQEKNNGC